MALSTDPEVARKVVEQSSHGFMCRRGLGWLLQGLVRHHTKFDDHKIVQQLDRLRGVERRGPLVGKVCLGGGRSGAGAALDEEVQGWIDWRWRCIVGARLGFESLEEMRIQWAKESHQIEKMRSI